MNPDSFQALCNKLGLTTRQAIPGWRLTRAFTGDLDLAAAIARKEERWRIRGVTRIAVKKTVVLSGWYFEYLTSVARSQLPVFLGMLLDAGFPVAIPTPTGMQVVKSREALPDTLKHFLPVSAKTASAQAAGLGIKRDNLFLLDSGEIANLQSRLSEYSGFSLPGLSHRKVDDGFVPLPDDLYRVDMKTLEKQVQPEDRLSLTISGTEMGWIAGFPGLHPHIRQVKFREMPDPELLRNILETFPNLDAVDLPEIPQMEHSKAFRQYPDLHISISDFFEKNQQLVEHFVTSYFVTNSGNDLCETRNNPPPNPELHLLHPYIGYDYYPTEEREEAFLIIRMGSVIPEDRCIFLRNVSLDGEKLFGLLNRLKPGGVLDAQHAKNFSSSLSQMSTLVSERQVNPWMQVNHANLANTDLNGYDLENLLTVAPNLTRLSVAGCENLRISPLWLTTTAGQLTHFDASNSPLKTTLCQSILNSQPNLVFLDFRGPSDIIWESITLYPGQLPHLTEFHAGPCEDYPIQSPTWNMLLAAAPNLRILTVAGLQLNPGESFHLPHLTHAEFSHTQSVESIRSILTSPNLVSLTLRQCNMAHFETLSEQEQKLPALEEVRIVDTTFNQGLLDNVLKIAPNLRVLEITNCALKSGHSLDLEPLPALKHLILKNCQSDSTWLYFMLMNTPHLEHLEISQSSDGQFIIGDLRFPELRSLVITDSILPADTLQKFLTKTPALVKLELSGSILWPYAPLDLPAGSLPALTVVYANPCRLPRDALIALILAAPNLREIHLGEYAFSPADWQWFERMYPRILFVREMEVPPQPDNFNTSGKETPIPVQDPPHYLASRFSQKPAETLPVSGDFEFTPGTRLKLSRIFQGTPQSMEIDPSFYHLETRRWDPQTASFAAWQPRPEQLAPATPPRMSLQGLREVFARDETPGNYRAIREYNNLDPDTWYQLPATSTRDQLLAFSSNLPEGEPEICRDSASGYYWFRVKTPIDFPVLISHVVASGFGFDMLQAQSAAVSQAVWEALAAVRFGPDGMLEPGPALDTLLQASEAERMEALQVWCTFESESSPNLPAGLSASEILNHSLTTRAGSCKHRAQLFSALAHNLQLPAFFISNDCHAFGTVVPENSSGFTVQMGGANAIVEMDAAYVDVTEVYEPSAPAPGAPETRPPRITEPAPDNPFKVWDNVPLAGKDAETLVPEAMAKSQTTGRLLLVTQDEASIEALHQAIVTQQRQGARCFYTPNPDAVSPTAACVSPEGEASDTLSPLGEFIREAETQPDIPFTWFVNWSDAEARHTALNSILDRPQPRIGDMLLPKNLHLVMMMDRASLATMGEEFHSRTRQRSQIPALQEPPRPVQPLRVVADTDLVLTDPARWEKALVGYHTQEGKKPVFIPGALLTATAPLTIHHAPWENPAFRTFARDLQRGQIHANGQWHTLPEGVPVQFATPEFHFPASPFDYSTAPPGEFHMALNPATLESFFSMVEFSPSGVTTRLGLLEQWQGNVFFLRVTDNLTEAQWHAFVTRADALGIKLVLSPSPGVTLPDALLQVYSPPPQDYLYQSPYVQTCVTNDEDFALQYFGGDCIVPITEHTSFESLFTDAHLDDTDNLVGGETDLTTALREGRHVVLHGAFSPELVQKMHSLLAGQGLMTVNGKLVQVPPRRITLISDSDTPFSGIAYSRLDYPPGIDLARLAPAPRERLLTCYQKLHIQPCYSHFRDFPQSSEEEEQMAWAMRLESGLLRGAGASPVIAEPDTISPPTTPAMLFDWLYGDEKLPFVFLVSESGAGKSYFMQKELPKHAESQDDPLKVYHGMSALRDWLTHTDGKAILFIDEANISDEDYRIFSNLARGAREVWLDGKRYPLSEGQKVVFAGNPLNYGGRKEADLFRRFPHYREFRSPPLNLILEPVIQQCGFSDPAGIFDMIRPWYEEAKKSGLNITPRNALMMVLKAFEMKVHFPHFPERVVMQQAMLEVLKTLHADPQKSRGIRRALKGTLEKDPLWTTHGKELKTALSDMLPKTAGKGWIWTASREKIALTVLSLLRIGELKKNNKIDNAQGILGFLIEGMPGLGKSRLIQSILQEKDIKHVQIPVHDPVAARDLLLKAFRQGLVAIIDEFNSFPDENLLNSLLSGVDPENPDAKPAPGFCILATQNPASLQQKEMLSKALDNRMMTLTLKDYSIEELQHILPAAFNLDPPIANKRIREWEHARDYARQEGLQEPDFRTLFEQAQAESQLTNPQAAQSAASSSSSSFSH